MSTVLWLLKERGKIAQVLSPGSHIYWQDTVLAWARSLFAMLQWVSQKRGIGSGEMSYTCRTVNREKSTPGSEADELMHAAFCTCRDAEVLSLFAAIINKLKERMVAEVPKIFEAVFQVTLQMITKNFEVNLLMTLDGSLMLQVCCAADTHLVLDLCTSSSRHCLACTWCAHLPHANVWLACGVHIFLTPMSGLHVVCTSSSCQCLACMWCAHLPHAKVWLACGVHIFLTPMSGLHVVCTSSTILP